MLAQRLRARVHEDDTLGCPSLHGAPPSTRLTPSSPTDLSCDDVRSCAAALRATTHSLHDRDPGTPVRTGADETRGTPVVQCGDHLRWSGQRLARHVDILGRN